MPIIPPDPDFRLADSDAADALRRTARTLDDSAGTLQAQRGTLTAMNEGRGVDRTLDAIDRVAVRLRAAADAATAGAELHAAAVAARDHFRTVTASATVADTEAAYAAWQALRVKLMAADDRHAAVVRARMVEAQQRYYAMLDTREGAIHGYETAEDAATAAFRTRVEQTQSRWNDRSTAPEQATPPPAPTAPAAPAPPAPTAPAAPAPRAAPAPAAAVAAPAPGAATAALPAPETAPVAFPLAPATAPDTQLSATPETSTPAAPSGSDGVNSALAALLAQQAQPQQQPVQMPQQMPMVPTPALTPASAQQRQTDSADRSPDDLLAQLRDMAAGPVPVPSMATVAAPAVTIPAPAEPETLTLAAPSNTPGALSALPPLNPVTTGTSLTGLTTDTNVTGRPDGAAVRTATSPTHLAGAGTANAAAANAGLAGAAGTAGQPMMPMGAPMMGGPGGGGGNAKRDLVTAKLTDDQAELMGLETLAEAVPGGTIAQKKDG